MLQILAIGIGGFIGAILRFLTGEWVHSIFPNTTFPVGTFSVNIIGSFVIGFFLSYVQQRPINPYVQTMIVTGLLGSFTTFSTFSNDTLKLFNQGLIINGLLYLLLSVVIGLIFVYLGFLLGKN